MLEGSVRDAGGKHKEILKGSERTFWKYCKNKDIRKILVGRCKEPAGILYEGKGESLDTVPLKRY